MTEGRARLGLALLSALAGTGCVLPEPVNYEPAPSQAADQAPMIEATSPADHVVQSQQSMGSVANRGCYVEVALDQVEDDDLSANLAARFYVNESNPAVQAPLAQYPIFFGSGAAGASASSDIALTIASEDTPSLRQLYPPKRIELDPLAAEGLLAPLPADGSPGEPNYLEVFVSDGFDPTTYAPKPAPGRAVTSTFWFLDLTACDPRVP